MAEVAFAKMLHERYEIEIELDFNYYPRGKWDDQDAEINGWRIDVKATRKGGRWMLIEWSKLDFRQKQNKLSHLYVMASVDWDRNHDLPRRDVELVGCASIQKIKPGDLPTEILHKGTCIPGTQTPIQADNYGISFTALEDDWDYVIQYIVFPNTATDNALALDNRFGSDGFNSFQGRWKAMNMFYYDESEHSRKLTQKTFEADNFSENFVASIVGYSADSAIIVEEDYLCFEAKHKKVYTVEGELKSTIIAKKKYVSGFGSMKKEDIQLISDLLDVAVNNNVFIYICVFNKVEYLMLQLFRSYKNSLYVDADSLRYSISKLVALYRPFNVYDAIFRNDNSFIAELRSFLKKVKLENELKNKRPAETVAIEQVLILLNDSAEIASVSWDYGIAFQGFKKYLDEIGVEDYRLIIDKEGDGKTLRAAQEEGLKHCSEEDSQKCAGLRISDFIAGIISSLLKAIRNSYEPGPTPKTEKLLFLKKSWFNIREEHLILYRKLEILIIEQHNVWDKVYSGKYADDLVYLICLLRYFSSFENIEQFRKTTVEQHQIDLNSMAVSFLRNQFDRMKSKLPVDAVNISPDGVFYNQKGAKCFFNYKKHEILPIGNTPQKYNVLSAGFFGAAEKACVTILEGEMPKCYLLPDELMDWAKSLVFLANLGHNLFPVVVEFRKLGEQYYAEIE